MNPFMFGIYMAIVPSAVIVIPALVYLYLKGRRNKQGWND